MKIRIFGPGCSRCQTVEQRTYNVLASLDIVADVEKVSNLGKMAEMGIMATPALAIDDKVKCVGRVPSEAEIADWVKAASE